jgi:hypothetical protein
MSTENSYCKLQLKQLQFSFLLLECVCELSYDGSDEQHS